MSHKVIMIWPLLWRWPLGPLCRSVRLLMRYVWRQFFSCCLSLDPCRSPWTHLGRIRIEIAPRTCRLGNQIDGSLGLRPACCLLVLLGPKANTTTRSNCCNVWWCLLHGFGRMLSVLIRRRNSEHMWDFPPCQVQIVLTRLADGCFCWTLSISVVIKASYCLLRWSLRWRQSACKLKVITFFLLSVYLKWMCVYRRGWDPALTSIMLCLIAMIHD